MSGSSSSGSGSFRVYRFVTIAILLWLTICTGWIGDHGTVTAEELEGGEGGGGRSNDTAMHSALNPNSTMLNSILNNTLVTPTLGSANIVDAREGSKDAYAILYPWLVQLLGCMSLVLLTRFNIPVPYAAVMFIWGTILGVLATNAPRIDSALPRLIDSITSWINIDSATLLLIFLPGLIFKDAVEIPINLFQGTYGIPVIKFVANLSNAFNLIAPFIVVVVLCRYYHFNETHARLSFFRPKFSRYCTDMGIILSYGTSGNRLVRCSGVLLSPIRRTIGLLWLVWLVGTRCNSCLHRYVG